MSALRERLRRPGPYLVLVALVGLCVLADGFRAPANQATAALYVRFVSGYQSAVSPGLSSWIECRYQTTCSRYSVTAVERFGLFRGLAMTAARLSRCTSDVPLGSRDPVADR